MSRFPRGYVEDLKPVERPIVASTNVVVGAFRCPTTDPAFRGSEELRCNYVVFPRTAIEMSVSGHRRFVSTAANATFHSPGSSYARRAVDPRGDLCDYVVLSPELLRVVAAEVDPNSRFCSHDAPEPRFRLPVCPLPPEVFLLQRRFFAKAAAGAFAAELMLEEEATRLVGSILRVAAGAPARTAIQARDGRRAEAVERACAFMAAHPRRNLQLAEIAAAAFVSPYHLARIFAHATGFTLHGFLTALRLRDAAGLLEETRERLKRLAASAGFSSHGHFTRAFQKEFGLSPSDYRLEHLVRSSQRRQSSATASRTGMGQGRSRAARPIASALP